MTYFEINDKKLRQKIFLSILLITMCLAIIIWMCYPPLFGPEEAHFNIWQKIFSVSLYLIVILICLWSILISILSGTKEFALFGLKIGFEEDGIIILKKDFKYKIPTSDIIVIYDNQYAFSIIFYYQEKPFALEVIKKCFSPFLIETMNKTFSQFSYFTTSRSNFLDICRKHEIKSQSKTSSFEYLIGKPSPSTQAKR